MIDREKVLKGLECCCSMTGNACRQCPYDEECAKMIGSGSAHLCANALELLKEQQETIELQGSLLTLAHAAMSHGKKEGLTNGARPGRNREDPASHS